MSLFETLFFYRIPRFPTFRKRSYKKRPKEVPIAALAVNLAKEMLHETSESPLVLQATPSSLRKSTIIPHCCETTAVSSHRKYETYPYHPLNENKKSG